MKLVNRFLALGFVLLLNYYYLHQWMVEKTATLSDFAALFVLFFAVVYLLIVFSTELKITGKKAAQNLLLFLLSFSFMLLASEIALRIFDSNLMSYGERNGAGHYASAYRVGLHKCDSCGDGYFFINQPHGTEEFYKPEFHYLHQYNSLGLRDHEFTEHKDSNEYRILGLGDSFAEGVGTSADSTWLKQLEYLLAADSQNHRIHFTTMNGGAHGSDLIFSYDLLEKCLLKYQPDMVILNLNSTDVGDIISRGVEERKNIHNGYIEGRGPWWEYLYGSSYVVRLIVINGLHFNWELLSPKQQEVENQYALHAISDKIKQYQQLARQNHFSFILVIQPLQNELSHNILNKLQLDPSLKTLDLAPFLAQKIKSAHAPLRDYYWPVDGHFTTKGYYAEAEAIYTQFWPHLNPGQE